MTTKLILDGGFDNLCCWVEGLLPLSDRADFVRTSESLLAAGQDPRGVWPKFAVWLLCNEQYGLYGLLDEHGVRGDARRLLVDVAKLFTKGCREPQTWLEAAERALHIGGRAWAKDNMVAYFCSCAAMVCARHEQSVWEGTTHVYLTHGLFCMTVRAFLISRTDEARRESYRAMGKKLNTLLAQADILPG